MLKQDLKIFEKLNIWEKNKHRTLFKNNLDLENYQNYFLEKLLKNKEIYDPIWLMSSGTTSNRPKRYKFPSKFYATVENHHIWRIMHSHGIDSGNVVKIFQGTEANATNCLVESNAIPSLGLMNKSWELIYDPMKVDSDFWKKTFISIEDLKPKFLYTSPSVFESFYEYMNKKFNFPIIFSCEILTDAIRKKSDSLFLKSIDKMRDWTTGFGFFECPYKTKHVYDELCLVQQIKKDSIESTDFFNYCEMFVKKASDDVVNIDKKLCDCGIFGNTLKSFEGKFFECLISRSGKRYSANYISNILSSFSFELNQYQITQDKEKNIEFKTNNELSNEAAIQIANIFNQLIMDDGGFLTLYKNEQLINKKDNIKLSFKKGNFLLNKNKKISLRNIG